MIMHLLKLIMIYHMQIWFYFKQNNYCHHMVYFTVTDLFTRMWEFLEAIVLSGGIDFIQYLLSMYHPVCHFMYVCLWTHVLMEDQTMKSNILLS